MPIMTATLTAAEIAAAEAAAVAAAEIAAAEAAATAAAQAAAAEAAAASATSAGSTAAATETGITAANAAGTGAGAGTNAGITAVSPQQAAYMDASTASINPGITQGVQPLPAATTPVATTPAGIPEGLQMNTPMGQQAAAGVQPINVQPAGYGNVVDAGGLTQPAAEPSAFARGFDRFATFVETNPKTAAAMGYAGAYSLGLLDPKEPPGPKKYNGPLSKYKMSNDFQGRTANPEDYRYTPRYATGGIMGAGPVEQMSNQNAIGANTGYPMANVQQGTYSTPFQTPVSQNVVSGTQDVGVNPYTGEQRFASGGITGDGSLNLQIPLELNGGSGNVSGYQAAGSGNGQSDSQAAISYPQTQSQQNTQTGFSGLNNAMTSATGGPGMFDNAIVEPTFAQGGIASYAKGGNLASSLDYYTNMMDGHNTRRAAPEKGDVGIYHDMDPDTRYQDALTAAQIRQAKVNKRANMQLPSQKRPTPMGQLNLRPPGGKAEAGGSTLDPENAAQGGIMQVRGGHLGGYAAGGNPRLLKGPGDGMSDNIPATIAGKQPARLADGEFVVPADVVSHLGNGSTEAGAKKLHQMMTEVRRARTGNPKQGKQINPNKFTPK